MATSSLKKSFIISSKKEANSLAEMFRQSIKEKPTQNAIVTPSVSKERLQEIINAKFR